MSKTHMNTSPTKAKATGIRCVFFVCFLVSFFSALTHVGVAAAGAPLLSVHWCHGWAPLPRGLSFVYCCGPRRPSCPYYYVGPNNNLFFSAIKIGSFPVNISCSPRP